MLPNFKSDWTLIKSSKLKPFGFIGYEFTLYDKVGFGHQEVRSKTASGIWFKIIRLMKEDIRMVKEEAK
jgi:hypothetical protein